MATFNATFTQNATFKSSLKESGNLKSTFGDVQKVEASDYEKLSNRPQINGVELIGNKTSKQIFVQDIMDEITAQDIDKIIFGG